MKKSLMAVWCAMAVFLAHAQQDVLYCGQTQATELLFQQRPHQHKVSQEANAQLEAEAQAFQRTSVNDPYIIPVVFHVIHNNGPENISDAQIYDAMEILNRDCRKQNPDTVQILDGFAGIAADVEVEFRLAQIDPAGNCTKGITRTVSGLTYQGNNQMTSLIQWPRDMYMNVWVCSYANGAAGYTYLPGSVDGVWGADIDGIVVRSDYLGSIGTSSPNRSRTLTHEIGHWLNLYHTWGNGNTPAVSENCGQDDFVTDTPNTVGWTSCSLQGQSCGDSDNVQNYMEYSYCSRMFTGGQRDRMHAALQSSVAERNQLWQVENLIATGTMDLEPVLCAAEFEVDRQVICVGDMVQFTDGSFNGPTSWSWDFGDGTTLSGSTDAEQNPTHAYSAPGEYTIALTVGNGATEVSTEAVAAVTVLPVEALPFAESFESDAWEGDWFVYNPGDDQEFNDTGAGAFSGSRSLRLNNNSNGIEDNFDWFESKTFDASNADVVYLSYKWAYANRLQETDDRLRVKVSGDCGQTWTIRELHRGFTDLPTHEPTNISWFPNGSDEWTGNVIEITEELFLTENMRVQFEFQAKGGNNLYLDDINISAENPVGISAPANIDAFVRIFPNPADEQLTVQLSAPVSGAVDVELLDASGRCVRKVEAANWSQGDAITIDVQTLASGWYAARVLGSFGAVSRPVLIR